MSGICKTHTYHDPECNRCTALPYDSRYEEHMEIIEVDLSPRLETFLFNELLRLNCRPSDYFKYMLNDYIASLDVPLSPKGETDNPDVGEQSTTRKRKKKSKRTTE